jgi:hypothetical protein
MRKRKKFNAMQKCERDAKKRKILHCIASLFFFKKKKREKSLIDRSFAFTFPSHYQPWGALPGKSPYLKNHAVEIFLDCAVAFSTFKCPKISRVFEKRLSPSGGWGIMLSPSFFPNLT